MDYIIQKKSLALLAKFIRNDLDGIPAYGYTVQKPPARGCESTGESAAARLARSVPEREGMSSAALKRLVDAITAETATLGAHGIMVLRHGKVIAEGYYAPFRADVPHMIYSISKSVLSTAIGMAVDEGLLSLDERVADIFPGVAPPQHKNFAGGITVRHLLTMSTGTRFNEVGTMLDGDWVRMFLESTPKFEAGSNFDYNSLNSYMLAAILTKRAKMSVVDYLEPRLFEPLGIAQHPWEVCPRSIEKGGWGLSLRLEDAAKLGQLYLDGGLWEGKRLLSEEWIRQATSKQIETPKAELKNGYGYQIWVGDDDGSYQFNGAFGQYVLVMPKYDAVAAIYSGSASLFAQGPLRGLIADCFSDASQTPLPPNPAAFAELRDALASLRFSPSINDGECGVDAKEFAQIACALDGREYRLEKTAGGLFPRALQAVHGNFTAGADMIRFRKAEQGLEITLYERGERNAIFVRGDGEYSDSYVAMRGEWQIVGARALWKFADEGIRLCVIAPFIETPSTRLINMVIREDEIQMTFDESPDMISCVRMLFELVGVSAAAALQKILPVIQRGKIERRMQAIAAPGVKGVRIVDNSARPAFTT